MLGITEGGIKRDASKLHLLALEDLDARTRSAKAANALVADLLNDMGGEANVNAAQYEIIRRAAIMGAICGDLEVSWLTTKTCDLTLLGTLAERQRRLLECLGRVDGFDQDEAEGERDEGTVIARSLLATKGDALEALEFADGLLDARPRFVDDFREESWSVGCSRAMRNDRTNAALAGAVAIGFGVVTFVGDGGARQNIRSDVEQEFEVAAVAGFAPGQMEGERQAVEVDLEVDFG